MIKEIKCTPLQSTEIENSTILNDQPRQIQQNNPDAPRLNNNELTITTTEIHNRNIDLEIIENNNNSEPKEHPEAKKLRNEEEIEKLRNEIKIEKDKVERLSNELEIEILRNEIKILCNELETIKRNAVLKDLILENIRVINEIIIQQSRRNRTTPLIISCDKKMSIVELAHQAAPAHKRMENNQKYCKLILPWLKLYKINGHSAVLRSWQIFAMIASGHTDYTEKFFFEELKKTNNKNDVIVEGINTLVNQAISQLTKITDEYFSLFRVLLDVNDSIQSKVKAINDYINLEFTNPLENTFNDEQSALEFFVTYDIIITSLVTDIATCATALSTALKYLENVKSYPATLYNFQTIQSILANCRTYYKEECRISKNPITILIEQIGSPYLTTHFATIKFLGKLIKGFSLQIKKAEAEKNAIISAKKQVALEARTASAVTQGRGRGKKRRHQQIGTNIISNNNTHQIAPDNPQAQVTTKLVDRVVIEETEQTINSQSSNDNPSSNNNHETVSCSEPQETLNNDYLQYLGPDDVVLMEAVLRLFDKDRETKQKQRAAQKESNSTSTNNPISQQAPAQNVPPFIKLTIEQKSLAHALLSEPPPHLEIEGKAVEILFRRLGAQVEGNGGSTHSISWGGKHADTYHTTHTPGKGDNDLLTSKYAKRVGYALRLGAQLGFFAKESIDA